MDPSTSDIIEVGAARFIDGKNTEIYSSLIRPTRPIPDRISALTGLTTGELDWARSFSEVMPDFLDFLGNSPIVAHNADFDMGFLATKLPRINVEMPSNIIWDNLKLGVLLYPEMQSFGLESLADHFSIPFRKTHRATDDCIITGQLFLTFLKNAPAIWCRELWDKLTGVYLAGSALGSLLHEISGHPDFDDYANLESVRTPLSSVPIQLSKPLTELKIPDDNQDVLIRVGPDDIANPDSIIRDTKPYKNKRRHYFAFPASQYPGDFWGMDKKWNEIIDRSPDIVIYPGRERILCKRQMRIFIEDEVENPLSLTGYETAVLYSFAQTSVDGNFSRLSWWIWNNLKNIPTAIPFISASNCNPSTCQDSDSCFYMKSLDKALKSKILGFPYRVMKEEGGIPRAKGTRLKADFTFFNPEGIFRDNLIGGIRSFVLNHESVLMDKIIKYLPEPDSGKAREVGEKALDSMKLLLEMVDRLISTSSHKRLQKGKRFFLFIDDNLEKESLELLDEIKKLCGIAIEFLISIPENAPPSAKLIASMLNQDVEKMLESAQLAESGNMVLCLDKIEDGLFDDCRFLFFPHIYRKGFLELPNGTEKLFFISHHISKSDDWERYLRFLGRESSSYDFFDVSPGIPEGNNIYITSGDEKDQISKKKVMNIKGDEISYIISNFPGRSLVIVRGSQELLNFKYRLSPRLKESGYWPLFQKQDGPKGLLIKEFSKHKNVVFFGLTDLLEDINLFEQPPDNLILESLHLTSLQDPIEAFIKMEMENAGLDHLSDYLEPKIHFTITKSLRRWKNHLYGKARIFILDERLADSDYGVSFLESLDSSRQEI